MAEDQVFFENCSASENSTKSLFQKETRYISSAYAGCLFDEHVTGKTKSGIDSLCEVSTVFIVVLAAQFIRNKLCSRKVQLKN